MWEFSLRLNNNPLTSAWEFLCGASASAGLAMR
jgi:hypothetical protein